MFYYGSEDHFKGTKWLYDAASIKNPLQGNETFL